MINITESMIDEIIADSITGSVKKEILSNYNINCFNNIKLYRDPNAGNFEAYYTYDNISPDIIQKIDEIKL